MSSITTQTPTVTQVPARGAGSKTRLRLTARGRRALLGAAAAPVAAFFAFSVLTGGSALASGEQTAPAAFETVTVLPGDTLWSIATATAPEADPRDVIDDIQRLNSLSGGTIQVGTTIAIPAQYSR